MATAYRIWAEQNGANTTRDADNIYIDEIGYHFIQEQAIEIANTYIQNNFFHKKISLYKNKSENWEATDFCSYGKTIHVDKVTILV